MSIEFTPSSKKPRLVSGILQIPIIVSHEQQMRSVMPETTTIAYKLGQEVEPSRKGSQSKNDQATYQVPMNIQVGRQVNQIYEDPSRVTIPISRPQTMYTTPIIMTQTNISMGWPSLILLNCE